ncbi:hypothetical protein [Geobacter sp.]|uniref:hypothetical protein n=1 Tax=Geobacter sp. TaxID=46610 RepID=UPI002621DC53|nr:hypothetical protein [Geobacter sp.]
MKAARVVLVGRSRRWKWFVISDHARHSTSIFIQKDLEAVKEVGTVVVAEKDVTAFDPSDNDVLQQMRYVETS